MKLSRINLAIALVLVVTVVILRLMPHAANFAPVAAVAIFGGAVLPRKLAVWASLVAIVIADMIIGFHDLVVLTWGCYALTALASSYWLQKRSLLRGASLTIAASFLFFIVTNLGVWQFSGMYAHTLQGLEQCFTLALPFFRNTLLSDLIYTGALFGIYALAVQLSARTVRHLDAHRAI